MDTLSRHDHGRFEFRTATGSPYVIENEFESSGFKQLEAEK